METETTHPTNRATDEQIVCRTEKVNFKKSAIHGTGGFAAVDIARGERVIQYIGEIIDKAESLRRCENDNEYIFDLDETHDMDGNVEWNPARFINHSCEPNCESEIDGHEIWILALRDIRAGEELSFNYCYDMEDYHDHPCRCGTSECVGFMVAEAYFEDVLRQRELTASVPA